MSKRYLSFWVQGKKRTVTDDASTSRFSHFPRQNLLLSATLNERVNHLAKISLEDPVLIGLTDKQMQVNPLHEPISNADSDMGNEKGNTVKSLHSSDEEYKIPSQLCQSYIQVSCGSRLVVLLSILKDLFEREASQKIVVFFSTCDAVDFHYSLVTEFKWSPASQSEEESKEMFLRCKVYRSHGKMENEDRRATFEAFKAEKCGLLLTTDVTARGLDLPKVRCIIQYDSPGEATEYVHRVGRTARLGQKGESLLFLQPSEIEYLRHLEKHGVLLKEYPIIKLLNGLPANGFKGYVKKFDSIERHPWFLSLYKALETFISTTPKIKKLAKNAFWSWVKAYAAHRGELKGIFVVKKLHLGHVTKSFALKEQPSLVSSKSSQKTLKKRKRDQKQQGFSKKLRFAHKS